MTKYTIRDLKRLGYGYMVLDILKKKEMTLDKFCKSESKTNNYYWISPSTLKQYFRNDGTTKFRFMAAQRLGYSEIEILNMVKNKLIKVISEVIDDLMTYRKDEEFLKLLNELCLKYDLMDQLTELSKKDILYKLNQVKLKAHQYKLCDDIVISIENAIKNIEEYNDCKALRKTLIDIIYDINIKIKELNQVRELSIVALSSSNTLCLLSKK